MSIQKFLYTFFFLMLAICAQATHLRSAHIKIEPLCLSTLTYRVTVTVYMNTLSQTPFGGFTLFDGHLDFGDGILQIIPETQAIARPDLGPNIGVASYTITHTYAAPGFYRVTYFERDRSAGILNIPNSGDVPYVSWTSLRVSQETVCNTLPVLNIPPVDRACSFNTFTHTPGAFDEQGDSLSYELGVPFRDANNEVIGYDDPDDPRFYTDFSHGNEEGTGPPSFVINPVNGLITWNAPGMAGEYNIAFRIREWRRNTLTGVYELLSITTRDMQIVVSAACANKRPDLIEVPVDTCVVAGAVLDFTIKGVDPENREVKIEVFSEVIDFPTDKLPATYSPDPAVFGPSDPPAELHFHWTTDCIHPRQQPYQVVFKITDNPPHEAQLTAFKTWNIKVMAPAPVWKDHTLDLIRRHTVLEWEPYACENAARIQIWRRVGAYPYAPGECDTGLPKFLDYDLIGEVDPDETTFRDTNFDKGLTVGAQYCYRLVAAFDANTSSIISPDFCFDPIETDAPVLTHITVEQTDTEDGHVRVSWRSPFAINKVQFPEPYEYEVYRAYGFAHDIGLQKIEPRVGDTTFLDKTLNTLDSVYNYRVVVYAKPQGSDEFVPVDTSARASSVRLMATPGLNQIELTWRDSVAWSNVAFTNPWHRIYRGVHGEPENEMVLLDSVNVALNGFQYLDDNLQHNMYYTYKVLTRGTYGNPKIRLQENFSQITSLYPDSNLLPCVAENAIAFTDCETFRITTPCEQDKFSNTIYWTMVPSDNCRMDIRYYKVYAASDSTEEFELLADHVTDQVYVDNNLSSVAKCYKVSAVDTRGNEGPLSNVICNDNCPFFSLPNVFTPNADGCNDLFSAFYYPADGGLCDDPDVFMCPRFVNHVSFRVFNRWGREVYSYSSGENKPVTINWDGKDNQGNDLDNGTYFYRAEVKFDVHDPTLQKDRIKGWIQLMR
ncbi:MAG TPA: gliding motility-associated C-terminal domain-containing protein [Ohtaekwangia sp.]